MSLRKLLHRFRQIDAWLVWPALAVVVFGELTHVPILEDLNIWDKALHFTAYFGLALMTTIAVRADRRTLWWALGLILLGGALEIIQGLTGRDADIWDEAANTFGVLVGTATGWAGIYVLKARRLLDEGSS